MTWRRKTDDHPEAPVPSDERPTAEIKPTEWDLADKAYQADPLAPVATAATPEKKTTVAAPSDVQGSLDLLAAYYRRNGDGARTTAIEFAQAVLKGEQEIPE